MLKRFFVSVRASAGVVASGVSLLSICTPAAAQVPPVPLPAPPDGRTIENPTGRITLSDALALALLQSPDLAPFAWEARAREALVLQAGVLPNPVLGILGEDLGVSRLAGASESSGTVEPQTTIQLSQLVELGGKRAARRKLAELDRDLAAWDYEAARIEVFARVTRAFIDVLAAQESAFLAARTTRAVAEVERSVTARVAAGVVSPIEETKARIALASVLVESDRAQRFVEAARVRLAATWGSTEAAFVSVAGELTEAPPLPALEELKARLAGNPYLARWAAEISRREAALALERSKRIPDLSLIAGYRRFNDLGENAFVVGGSIALPLFDRNRGGIEAAGMRLRSAGEERRAVEAGLAADLAEAYGALSGAHAAVMALRGAVLPGAQHAFEAVSEGYRAGKFGYLDVLDAQRTFIAASGQYVGALSEYHKAVVDVERLIGAPLQE